MNRASSKTITRKNLFRLIDEWVNDRERYYFRGEPKENYTLVPSLLREPTYGRLSEGYAAEKKPAHLENRLLERFRRYTSHIYHSHSDFHGRHFSNLEMLCLAQHNGLPTLLLDWTLNPVVGLYFALRSHYYQDPMKENAVLWVMRLAPYQKRKHLTVHLEDPREEWEKYVEQVKDSCPLLVVPLVFTHRIAAQTGRFIYSAFLENGDKGIDKIGLKDKPWTKLERYLIPADERQPLLKQLTILGMHEGTLFPDLEGWAKYLKDGNL